MPDRNNPFSALDPRLAINLRWTLRDIRERRQKLSPFDVAHLEMLIEMGLIEMRDDLPVLTNAGRDAIA